MTELSYTAWDDNRYQWPPPEGWYQASDGKWWPEGYGPVAGREATSGSSDVADTEHAPSADQSRDESWHVESADVATGFEDIESDEFDAGIQAEVADVVETAEPAEEGVETVDPFDTLDEAAFSVGANGTSEVASVAETEDDPEPHQDSGSPYDSESRYDSEPHQDSESRLSTSSAGMAASGFAPRTEGTSSLGLAGWAQAGPSLDSATVDVPATDDPGDPVDNTLSRLDDLKRQVEQQSFPTEVAGAQASTASDLDVAGFDPTETLDIDPDDLKLESNPYYGGGDDVDAYSASTDVGTDEPTDVDAYESDAISGDAEVGQGFDHRVDSDPDGYGFAPVDEAPAESGSAAETRQYGFDGEAPAPAGDQPVAMGADFGATQADYSATPTLAPISSPTPSSGRGRIVVYAIIGLLALAVAGVAGYLLFQLQGDDGDVSGTDSGAAAVDGTDAGPSDVSGQGPGSFSNPHDLAGGVRLTVPLGDDGTEVWMLQVREPATTSDLGDDQVEVTSRIRVRNDSTSGDLTASDLRFVLVSADGSTGTRAEPGCSTGDDLDRQATIEPGKDIEGNVCWTVPAAQATDALLGIESVHAGGRVHVEMS